MWQQIHVIIKDIGKTPAFVQQASTPESPIRRTLNIERRGALVAFQADGQQLSINGIGRSRSTDGVDLLSQQNPLPRLKTQQSTFRWGHPNPVDVKPAAK